MSIVCSRCGNIHGSGACPRCGTPAPAGQEGGTIGHGPRWQQTTWGRILIGLILSQGLFYGLRHLLTGILMAVQGEEPTSSSYHLIQQGFALFGVIVGGLLAGSAQNAGFVLGALVGVANGVLAVMLKQNPAAAEKMGLIVQSLLHPGVGALAGWLGSVIWKPISVTTMVALQAPRKVPPRPTKSPFAGPIAWFRVLLGTAFVVAGSMSATVIFDRLMNMAGGKVTYVHEMQDQLILWEIKALVVILGAALAGATTPNGLKQGLCVGIWASILLIGLQASMTRNFLQMALFTSIGTLSLSLAGSWFGGQLFPPVIKTTARSMDAFT